MPKSTPSWQAIERALIELFEDYAIPITYERGDSFIRHKGVDYRISDWAKELERRL